MAQMLLEAMSGLATEVGRERPAGCSTLAAAIALRSDPDGHADAGDLDGLQAARAASANCPGLRARLPILAMTANAFAEDKAALSWMPAWMISSAKPVEPDALFGTILAWLDRAAQA
jgi:CheY-like chemotaxis protein